MEVIEDAKSKHMNSMKSYDDVFNAEKSKIEKI